MSTELKKRKVFMEENYDGNNVGTPITNQVEKGHAHNHLLFAIWLYQGKENYIHTFISRRV